MSAELDVRLFVGGEWRDGGAGRLAVTDPATGGPAGHVALADQRDVREAVAAAEAAFPAWAALPADERGAVLKRAAALLAERSAEIAAILSREGGKTEAEARGELGRAGETLAWNGEEAGRIEGRLMAGKAAGSRRLSVPTPVGVVAAFTAWNFPAVLATRKLGAILAAGCTGVLKAAEATPGTAAEVVRALADAGAPARRREPPVRRPRRGLGAPDRRARRARGHVHRLDARSGASSPVTRRAGRSGRCSSSAGTHR